MAMLFPNDLMKDPRKQARTQPTSASRSRPLLSRALSLLSSLSLFAISSTALGQKGPITVSAGSRTSSNPAVAGWSFVGEKEEFSFFFLFMAALFFSGPIFAIWRQKKEIGI